LWSWAWAWDKNGLKVLGYNDRGLSTGQGGYGSYNTKPKESFGA